MGFTSELRVVECYDLPEHAENNVIYLLMPKETSNDYHLARNRHEIRCHAAAARILGEAPSEVGCVEINR